MKPTVSEIEDALRKFDFSQTILHDFNKGKRGQFLESLLGISTGNNLLDLQDGELKTFKIGQTISITQVGHCLHEILETSVKFTESKVFDKLKQVIFIGYNKDGKFQFYKTINQEKFPNLYLELADDYEDICEKIRYSYRENTELHTTTGRHKLLQIRTKASQPYFPLSFNGVELKDKYMSFYLRNSFVKKYLT